MKYMTEHFIEPEGRYIPTEALPECPNVFNLSPNQRTSVIIPLAVIEPARQAHVNAKFPSYNPVDVRCNDLLGDTSSHEDQQWATQAPYSVQAIDGSIYVRDKILKDPQHPHATLHVLRIDYDPIQEQQPPLR